MDAKEARAAVADARHNEDGTVTLYPVPGAHVYPYPAEMGHFKPRKAAELLQYEPPAFSLRKPPDPEPAPPPPTPVEAPEQPEGPSEQDGSSDSSQEAAS